MVMVKNKKIISFGLVILLILAGLAVYFFVYKNNSNKSATDLTTQQNNQGVKIKENSVNNDMKSGSEQPPSPIESPNSTKKTVEVSFTAVNQVDSYVMVRTLISVLTSNGTCTLNISHNGNIIDTLSSDVQPQANITTCKGFNISTSSLPKGTIKLELSFDSTEYTGQTTKEFEVN